MKHILKHISILSAFLLSLTKGFAAPTKIGGIYYTLSGTSATVTYKSLGSGEYSGDIIIPSNITNGGVTYTVTAINDHAFNNCKNITSIIMPNTIKSIGTSAFFKCTGLTSISIPNSVTSIGESSFSNCTSLNSVSIGSSTKKIGNNAFYSCPMTSVTILATTPPTLGSEVFSNTTFTLTVPSGCKDTYAENTYWKDFTNIKEIGGGIKASSMSFTFSKKYLLTGKVILHLPVILPEESADQSLTWSSTDSSIATVDDDGTVTGVKAGNCTIKATTTDGSDLTASYTIKVCDPGLPGDVNGDGDITIADANAIVNIFLKE